MVNHVTGSSDTVHDYARQKLLSRGLSETTAVRARHADFFSTMARRICQVGTNTPGEALELLGDMRDNLRAALDWWLATARPLEDAPEGVGDARRVAVSGRLKRRSAHGLAATDRTMKSCA